MPIKALCYLLAAPRPTINGSTNRQIAAIEQIEVEKTKHIAIAVSLLCPTARKVDSYRVPRTPFYF